MLNYPIRYLTILFKLGEGCEEDAPLFLDVQYICMNASADEQIDITSLESIRDTPLRELYSDILHLVADPEGEDLSGRVSNSARCISLQLPFLVH